jgi:hypothetical protein
MLLVNRTEQARGVVAGKVAACLWHKQEVCMSPSFNGAINLTSSETNVPVM